MNDQMLLALVRKADPLPPAAGFGEPSQALLDRVLASARDERRQPRPLHRRRPLVIAAVLALFLLFIGAAFAFDLGLPVLDFGHAEKAPAGSPVVEDFATLDQHAPSGMATGVIAGETRRVGSFPLSSGGSMVLSVAPTRAGGFCAYYEVLGGGCDRDRTIPFSRALTIPGPIYPGSSKTLPAAFITGDTLIHGGSVVEVRFADGESAKVPLVWVSPPVDAGFFFYEVPEKHRELGHWATLLVLEDAHGRELARTRIPSVFKFLERQGSPIGPALKTH